MASPRRAEEIDRLLDEAGIIMGNIQRDAARKVKAQAHEAVMLRCIEQLRDSMRAAMDPSERDLLGQLFGGDCTRIARIRETLATVKFSTESNRADPRTVSCTEHCHIVEGVLRDLGHDAALSKAQDAIKKQMLAERQARLAKTWAAGESAAEAEARRSRAESQEIVEEWEAADGDEGDAPTGKTMLPRKDSDDWRLREEEARRKEEELRVKEPRPEVGYTWKGDVVSDSHLRETALVDARFIGSIIGKQGAMIKSIKEQSGAQVDIDQRGEGPRQVIVKGTKAQVQSARELVDDVVIKSLEWERRENERKEPWKRMARDTKTTGARPLTGMLSASLGGLRPAWMNKGEKPDVGDEGPAYSTLVILASRARLMTGKAYEVPAPMSNMGVGDRPRRKEDRTPPLGPKAAPSLGVDGSPEMTALPGPETPPEHSLGS